MKRTQKELDAAVMALFGTTGMLEQGAAVHFEVDHEHCVYTGTCKRRLKVLGWDDGRGIGLEPHPASLTQRFVEHYARDASARWPPRGVTPPLPGGGGASLAPSSSASARPIAKS